MNRDVPLSGNVTPGVSAACPRVSSASFRNSAKLSISAAISSARRAIRSWRSGGERFQDFVQCSAHLRLRFHNSFRCASVRSIVEAMILDEARAREPFGTRAPHSHFAKFRSTYGSTPPFLK